MPVFAFSVHSKDTVSIYKEINPAIVAIDSQLSDGLSCGTGCIIDKDGTIYEEKLTFHKAIAKRALNIEYNGDGDPVSVDIEFELGQNDDGYVLTIARDNVAASKYTISATAGSHGSISPSSIEVTAGSTISVSGNVLTCDSQTITATPASGYVANWSGVQPKANADIAVSVTFTQEQASYLMIMK